MSTILVGWAFYLSGPGDDQQAGLKSEPSPTARRHLAFIELLSMSLGQLKGVDIAEMNLLCAKDLPGAEDLDVGKCLARLDEWAAHVRRETDRHMYRFIQKPGQYRHSEGYFRMLMLITVLQQDFGVRYNPDRIREVDFSNSQDLFIHGMAGSGNGGTCVSMPVLYVAVGRRLGYPLKLALAKGHVFARWDGRGERFNIEATNQGLNCFSDEYYQAWPVKMTAREIASGRFLRSLSPAEELACFMASRGHCLTAIGKAGEAGLAYAHAHRLVPRDPAYAAWLRETADREKLTSTGSAQTRRRNSGRPKDAAAEARRIQAINENTRRRTADATHHASPRIPNPNPEQPR